MTHRPLISLSLPALAALLASCSGTPSCGNSHTYNTNAPRPLLKAPAGVTLPRPDNAYLIPEAGTATTPAPAAGTSATPCLVTPPSVLTKEDMAKPVKSAPPAKPVKASMAAKAPASPAPAAATTPPPQLATGGGME